MKKLLLILSVFLLFAQAKGQSVIRAQSNARAVVSVASYPAVLDDTHTVLWLDFTKGIIKSGNDLTAWADQSGDNNNSTSVSGAPQVTANGILFDGTDDNVRFSFALNRPAFVYAVLKQITWTDGDYILDGYDALTLPIQQGYGVSPAVAMNSWGSSTSDLILDTYSIIRIWSTVDGASLIIDEHDAETAPAFADMEGFSIGSPGASSNYSNIEVKEVIVRDVADDETAQTAIYGYLKTKYGL